MTLENRILVKLINENGVFKVVGTNEAVTPIRLDGQRIEVKGTKKEETIYFWQDIASAAQAIADQEPNAYSFSRVAEHIDEGRSIFAPRRDRYVFTLHKIPQSAIENESKSIQAADPIFYEVEVKK